MKGQAAEKAGIKAGDVLLKVDQDAIESVEGLQENLKKRTEGDAVAFTLRRDGEEQVIKLKLGGHE